jgi:predicted transposase/invertase (TIGR01784 family)
MPATPHDALFKAVLGDPEHARGVLRAVVPAAVAESIDWTTLAHCPGSFIDPELVGSHTDLLFSAAWCGGNDALLYLLFEHQSTSDGRMAFRLLRYLVRIWERWWDEHADRP